MTLAWALRMPTTPKLVLLALCDWANDEGFCFPSVRSIAARSCLSERHCQRVLSSLISDQWMSVVANLNGGSGSRRYQLSLFALKNGATSVGGDNLSALTAASSPGATSASPSGDEGGTRTVSTHQLEPVLPAIVFPPEFCEFDRAVVVKTIRDLDPELQQALVRELRGALAKKAIKKGWRMWFSTVVGRACAGEFVENLGLEIAAGDSRRSDEEAKAEKRRQEEAIRKERLADPAAQARVAAAAAAAFAAVRGGRDSNE